MTLRGCAAIAGLLLATPAEGQVMIGADVTAQSDYVWRGLTRSNRLSIQPSVVVGYKDAANVVSAGAWASVEPFRPGPNDFSNVGTSGELVGEADVWVQWDRRLQLLVTLDLSAGWTAYTFHGHTSSGGRGNAWNTHEAYVKAKLSQAQTVLTALGLPRKPPLAFEVSAWKDLGPIRGVYGEIAVEVDLPILPLGEPLSSLLVRAALGLSRGQRNVPGTELGHYDGNGATHFELSGATTLSAPLGRVQLTIHPAAHLQVGIDGATLRRGLAPGDRSRVFVWSSVTVSLLFPMRPAP